MCEWIVDNKLSIHLGKTESILFGTQNKLNKASNLNIRYGDQDIEQKLKVNYLGVTMDNNLAEKTMAESVL